MSGYGTANTWSTGPTNPPSWAPKQQELDRLHKYPAGPVRDHMAKIMGIKNYNRLGGSNKTRKRTNKRRKSRKSRRMKSRRRK
jgi:hypothetical protein